MKSVKKILTSVLIAGLLLCSNLTVFAAEDRDINEDYYVGYYDLMVSYQIDVQEDTVYVKDAYTGLNIWEAEKVEEDMYASTVAYARYIPNKEDTAGVLLNRGASVKRIGVSPNGWDIIEYEEKLYFLWYDDLSYDKPAPVASRRASGGSGGSYSSGSVASGGDASAGMTYMGTWCISAYEWTGNPCANGNFPTEWYTCAFNSAPRGATIYIEGLGYFVNEDYCGTPSRLDIYLGDPGACIQFGLQYHYVYIVN